ncbi:F-box domain-containing protein [Mycena kentingensis (nom. inval.)]|nr:F-box domain-containing protein [Mycena kentingensis (nom. inval.)]
MCACSNEDDIELMVDFMAVLAEQMHRIETTSSSASRTCTHSTSNNTWNSTAKGWSTRRSLLFYKHAPAAGIHLPWSQLVEFAAGNNTTQGCFHVLREGVNLTKCSFSIMEMTKRNVPGPVVHEKLEQLELLGESTDTAQPHYLSCFTFPALQTLVLLDSDSLSDNVLDKFLERSSPPLHTLRSCPCELQGIITIAPFMHLKQLVSLELRYASTKFLTSFFTVFAENADFLPRLENLIIWCRWRKRPPRARDDAVAAEAPTEATLAFVFKHLAKVYEDRRSLMGVECAVYINAVQPGRDYRTGRKVALKPPSE